MQIEARLRQTYPPYLCVGVVVHGLLCVWVLLIHIIKVAAIKHDGRRACVHLHMQAHGASFKLAHGTNRNCVSAHTRTRKHTNTHTHAHICTCAQVRDARAVWHVCGAHGPAFPAAPRAAGNSSMPHPVPV
jgi:hypothetical protein